jgi:hypothetical protein
MSTSTAVAQNNESRALHSDSGDVGLARGILDAWMRGDVDWVVEHSSADVEVRPAMWVDAPLRGPEGMSGFVTEVLPAYEGVVEVEGVRRTADPVELDVRLRAHMRLSDADRDVPLLMRFWIRDGKLIRFEGRSASGRR